MMNESEAKIFIQNAMAQSKNVLAELLLLAPKVFEVRKKSLGEYYSNLENCKKEIQSCEVAIKALEDVQRYQSLDKRLTDMFGSSLSLETVVDELEHYLTEPDMPHPINAKILTYEDAKAWEEYQTIGTPEECRVAVEKQTAKRPRIIGNAMICPSCPRCFKSASPTCCPSCGQRIDWEDEE